ncbi:MAG: AAA family ATPase [Candidatus Thorarchaeota archaeon]
MSNRNFLIILCGLPASGKSTFARNLKSYLSKMNSNQDVIIIDPDKIRNELYSGTFDPRKENLVKKKNLTKIQKALKKGYIVISDDLNYYTSMRHDLKEVAERLKVPFYIIYISTPVEQCIIWNDARGKLVPNSVINNVYEKFDYFNTYSWDKPFRTFNLSENNNLENKIKQLLKEIEQNINLKIEQSVVNKSQKFKDPYKESLDHITRKIVNHYMNNWNERSDVSKILGLRKEFIKHNLDNEMSNSEIAKKFNLFLKTHFHER